MVDFIFNTKLKTSPFISFFIFHIKSFDNYFFLLHNQLATFGLVDHWHMLKGKNP